MARDWRDTLFLPQTELAMRARLPEREPDILAMWQKLDLYGRLRRDSAGREKFVLHDGPPYANGHLHMGHALNKILKDVVNRSQQMLGKDANYVPGWDCHGLPIEWKIEERHREAGRAKEDVPVADFRRECRQFAEHWVGVQAAEFRRLGVVGDWDSAYTTMSYDAEASIVRELGKFLLNGGLYRGAKPVMWSVVEKTALAEAEIEYHDHTSTMCWVRFALQSPPRPDLAGVSALIWTTTPWTLPGNRAIAYGQDFTYVVMDVTAIGDDSRARIGEKLLVAESLVAAVASATGITGHEVTARLSGAELAGLVAAHPLAGQGYDFAVPLLAGDHVTLEQGTGLVHIAPGHGAEDWELGRSHNIAVPDTVDGDGTYFAHVPLFAGRAVYRPDGRTGDANDAVLEAIAAAGGLLARARLVHSYPHSWRSRAPLIFRNTPQWFISMETNDLRAKALAAIDQTRFVPPSGHTRLRGMIANRPDWCVSRQRAWGVPITVFVHKETGEPLRDAAVMARIVQAVAEDGADAWFDRPAESFLGPDHAADQYEQVSDILDVWFDSGCSHAYVLETRDDLAWPASLYLEGSDQHRGWFHSSLLESCGTRGRAPYNEVLTHGFVMDEHGRAMSKSLGNGMAPEEIIQSHGADILRLWVVASDYSADLRIGPEILKHQADAYRRLRNTLRFVLGNLHGIRPGERLSPAEMPDLERWVLHRL
ncbi:MAG: isoleucine--tRNA ligase, partial [Alphaproteobacteria bacterium]